MLVPLSLTTATAGRHTPTATTLLNFAPTQPVWLHDYAAATAQDLRLTPTFTFTVAQASVLDSRFALEFGSLRPTVTRSTAAAVPLLLYPNPARSTATLVLPAAATARPVQVLDALGRVVRQLELPTSATTLPLEVAGLPAGVYVVRVGAATARLVIE